MTGLNASLSDQKNEIFDYKPLWAIKKSMQQHYGKICKKASSTPGLARSPTKKTPFTRDLTDFNDGEGENIDDEEPEINDYQHKKTSHIRCKPSINESKKTGTISQMNSMGSSAGNLMSSQKNQFNEDFEGAIGIQGIRQSVALNSRDPLGYFDDKYLYESLLRYSKKFSANGDQDEDTDPTITLEVYVNSPISVQFLSSSSQPKASSEYKSVCRIGVQPSQILFSRTRYASSFQACGVEFESTNRIKVLQAFARQLHETMRGFLTTPHMSE